MTLLQPPKELAGEQPLVLTLMVSQDTTGKRRYVIPDAIEVEIVTTDGLAPRRLTLRHDSTVPESVVLKAGQYRKIAYRADWPKDVRGTVQLAPIGFDAAASIVALNWSADAARTATTVATPLVPLAGGAGGAQKSATEPSTPSSPSASQSVTAVPSSSEQASAELANAGSATATAALPTEKYRISFNEPVYFAVGPSEGDTTAKFQLSFKYRIFEPSDPRSRSLFDNLYFGYTQLSVWDLSEESKPFKDTNFRPSLFYELADTGARADWFSTLGIQAGLEHESNGKDGNDSRSINTVFVRPTLTWNSVFGNRLVVSPKIYYYLDKSDNPDIQKYRGYVDLLIKYGDPNALELATTLRKGTASTYGSIDAQLTYPVQRIFGPGFGGYLWLGVFTGYGETMIDYNHHSNAVRIGYSITR